MFLPTFLSHSRSLPPPPHPSSPPLSPDPPDQGSGIVQAGTSSGRHSFHHSIAAGDLQQATRMARYKELSM
jgi:hypothetical protein